MRKTLLLGLLFTAACGDIQIGPDDYPANADCVRHEGPPERVVCTTTAPPAPAPAP